MAKLYIKKFGDYHHIGYDDDKGQFIHLEKYISIDAAEIRLVHMINLIETIDSRFTSRIKKYLLRMGFARLTKSIGP
jgi:hypothetical protein